MRQTPRISDIAFAVESSARLRLTSPVANGTAHGPLRLDLIRRCSIEPVGVGSPTTQLVGTMEGRSDPKALTL